MHLPAYDDLPLFDGLDVRHARGLFGADDRLGSINLLTPDVVAAAAREVRTGAMFPLDLPLDLPNPPLFGRQQYRHEVFALNRHEMDDRLHDFHPQASTQWDSLQHVRCREFGYWDGSTDDPSDESVSLGIEHWARHGIAGRGVLIDMADWMLRHRPDYDPLQARPIHAREIEAAIAEQGLELRTGDIWCVRTGWVTAYRSLDEAGRQRYADDAAFAGLCGDHDTARLVWNQHPAALVADNPAVEMSPGDPAVGSLHRRMIPSLGMALGEMFDLDALAVACRADRRWTFMFVAAPLHLPGGIGSPGNSVAIR
jgi:hypothetical protein